MPYVLRPIEVIPGVQPVTDFTEQSTRHYTFTDKIRFVDGFPEKIGGWDIVSFTGKFSIQGCPRNVFSYVLNNNVSYIVGTHTNLYNISAQQLSNITPVETTTTTLNNVLSTFFGTLGNDPFATTSGSATVTITDTAHKFTNGGFADISGSTAVNGIPAIELNTTHSVGNVTTNTYDITVTTLATSTGSGGGAAVQRASRIVNVADVNDFVAGDNVVISNLAVSVGGIEAVNINGIRNIQSVTAGGYDIIADAFATSSVSGVGGSIDIAEQIPEGLCNPTTGAGYGLGQYGVGQYGVAKTATSPTPARIWSFDRFGDLIISTPGDQTGIYSWNGSVSTLPELVINAPTAINYTFTSNEIVVTLGAGDVGNRIQWSDQGNLTTWTSTAQNQAGQDDIEGASQFISHAALRGFNLLFTKDQVYTFRYIRKPFVWETRQLDGGRGLVAPNARTVVNGIAYWMGLDNFYYYKGGNVEIIPSNTTTQTTLKKFVFDNIDQANIEKSFAFYNEKFNEIWFHYPSDGSIEPDRIARLNIRDFTWTPDTLDRTAGEYPNILGSFPRMVDINGNFYRHEKGTDDNIVSLPFTLRTNYMSSGTNTLDLGAIVPDSIQNGDISLTINRKAYANSIVGTSSFTITDTDDKISFGRRINGRYIQYQIDGDVLGQSWRGGVWLQEIQEGSRK